MKVQCFVIRKIGTKQYFDGFGSFEITDNRHHPMIYETKEKAVEVVNSYDLKDVEVEQILVNFTDL